MSTDTNFVHLRRHGLDDLTDQMPTVARKRYRPQHRVLGETTDDIQRPTTVGEQSRMIPFPLPPRPDITAVVNLPSPGEGTRIMTGPVRATAPIPQPPAHAPRSWWRTLGDALQALWKRGVR